jgi:hypothetical protein
MLNRTSQEPASSNKQLPSDQQSITFRAAADPNLCILAVWLAKIPVHRLHIPGSLEYY